MTKTAKAASGPVPQNSPWTHWPRLIKAFIFKQRFIISVMCSIWLAYTFPHVGENGGPIRAEYSIKYGAVMVLFFISGISLKSSILKQALSHWRAHIVIQTISFGIAPAVGVGVSKLLLAFTSLNESLLAGIVIVSCMPTTISSNVLLTAASNGNEALSLINATLGNLLGIVLSPLLLELYLGARTEINVVKILKDISIMVLGPIFIGQFIQACFTSKVDYVTKRISCSAVSALMIMLLIYASFADNFARGTLRISFINVLAVIGVIWVLLPLLMGLCLWIGLMIKFSPPDIISIIFCGSTKTLSLGIALISIIYGNDPNNGLYYLPLLVQYASQLLIGGWSVGPLSKWVKSLAACLPVHSAIIKSASEPTATHVSVHQTSAPEPGCNNVLDTTKPGIQPVA